MSVLRTSCISFLCYHFSAIVSDSLCCKTTSKRSKWSSWSRCAMFYVHFLFWDLQRRDIWQMLIHNYSTPAENCCWYVSRTDWHKDSFWVPWPVKQRKISSRCSGVISTVSNISFFSNNLFFLMYCANIFCCTLKVITIVQWYILNNNIKIYK